MYFRIRIFIIQSNSLLSSLKDQYVKLKSNPGNSHIPALKEKIGCCSKLDGKIWHSIF